MPNLFGLSSELRCWCFEVDLLDEELVVVVTVGDVGDEVAVPPPGVPIPVAAMSIWPVDSARELKPRDSTSGVEGAVFTLRLK